WCIATVSGMSLAFADCLRFLFNDTAPPEIYTLALHDALPISHPPHDRPNRLKVVGDVGDTVDTSHHNRYPPVDSACFGGKYRRRSEEHTSELQSRENLVCRLLLEKK